jgi:hypothetical protein
MRAAPATPWLTAASKWKKAKAVGSSGQDAGSQ